MLGGVGAAVSNGGGYPISPPFTLIQLGTCRVHEPKSVVRRCRTNQPAQAVRKDETRVLQVRQRSMRECQKPVPLNWVLPRIVAEI